MTVREIVEKYLKENKFDGLFNGEGQCACELSDLIPCGNDDIMTCQCGYKHYCQDCSNDIKDNCEIDIDENNSGSFCISENKIARTGG